MFETQPVYVSQIHSNFLPYFSIMFLIDIFDYKKDVIQPESLRYQLISAWAGGLFSGQILIMTMDKVSYIMETNTDRLKEDYSSRGLEKNKVRVSGSLINKYKM